MYVDFFWPLTERCALAGRKIKKMQGVEKMLFVDSILTLKNASRISHYLMRGESKSKVSDQLRYKGISRGFFEVILLRGKKAAVFATTSAPPLPP